MKFIVWAITGVNLYFGANAFLNAIHVLHSSKYAQSTTVILRSCFSAWALTAPTPPGPATI